VLRSWKTSKPTDVREVRDGMIDDSVGNPDARRITEELFDPYPLPETTPACSENLVDDGGWIWIRG